MRISTAVSGAVVLLTILGVCTTATVGAQSTATATAEDVTLSGNGDEAWTEVTISASQGVSVADTGISLDTTEVAVTDVRSPYIQSENPLVEARIGPDGSYVWLNYTDIRSSQSDLTVGEVQITSQTDGPTELEASVLTDNYNNANYEEFDTVNREPVTITVEEDTSGNRSTDNETETPDQEEGEQEDEDGQEDDQQDDGTDEGTTDRTPQDERDDQETDVEGSTADQDKSTSSDSSEDGDGNGDTSTDSSDTDTTDDATAGNTSQESPTNDEEPPESRTGNNTSDGTDDSNSEGLPGFTAFVALLAILTVTVYRAE